MTTTRHPHSHTAIALAVLTLMSLFVFLPNISGEFLLDDKILVENNPFIRQLEDVHTYLAQEDGILDRNEWGESFHTRYYRPFINFSYHLDYRLWGLNPAGFRLTNWLLHLLTVFLLFYLLTRHTRSLVCGLVVALAFAVHPVQTETVSWIAARNNILTTLFSLAALICYTSSSIRKPIFKMALALIFFLLAVFSKEFGVMILPILVGYDLIFKEKFPRTIRSWLVYLPFVLLLGLYLLARSQVTGPLLDAPGTAPVMQRLLFMPYLVMYNICLLFIPVGLHNYLVFYPANMFGLQMIGGMLGLVLVGCLIWRFRQNKLIFFGSLSFLAGIFPVLNLVPTSAVTLIAMRWLYFPLAFLSFAAIGAIGNRPGRLKIVVLFLIVTLLGGYSFYLNREHWHDEKGFFTREVVKFNNYLYAGAYAKLLHANGQTGLAEKYFLVGIDAIPSGVENYIDYSAMLIEVNRPKEALSMAARGLEFAASRKSKGSLYNNQGMALARLGRMEAAVTAFEAAVENAPRNTTFISNLGSAYGMMAAYEKSVDVLENGLAMAPDAVGLRINLANTYMKMGAYQRAVKTLEAISLQIRNGNPGIERLLQRARDSR